MISHKILIFFRLLLLFISFSGYIMLLVKKYQIKVEFSLPILFSGIGCTMFYAGILNLLQEVVLVIFLGGLILFFYYIICRSRIQQIFCFGNIFFAIMVLFMACTVYRTVFLHIDNFNHWATVIKVMLNENRFPNFQDTIIEFQSYPLGSASFIYYIATVVGVHSEWMQMWAQILLLFSMAISLFAFPIKKYYVKCILMIYILLCMVSNVSGFRDLRVDTLLPMIGIAGVAICSFYKKDVISKWWAVLPIEVFLVCVKNSGFFFAAIIVGTYVFYSFEEKKKKGYWKKLLLLASGPILTFVLWMKHVSLVYVSGMNSRHSMTTANYANILKTKDKECIDNIMKMITERVFSLSNPFIYCLLITFILWGYCYFFRKEKVNSVIKNLVVELIIYCTYIGGLFGMYVFSMSQKEAKILVEFDRYHTAVIIFIFLFLFIEYMDTVEKSDTKRSICNVALGLLFCVILCCSIKLNIKDYYEYEYEGTARQEVESFLNDNNVQQGAKCIILCGKDYEYYTLQTARYILCSDKIEVYSDERLGEIKEPLSEYEYVLVFRETEENKNYMNSVYKE